jgi:hypothetical protein
VNIFVLKDYLSTGNTLFFRYVGSLHQRLFHITPADYDDFVGILFHAKLAFTWSIEGGAAFNQLLQTIKR